MKISIKISAILLVAGIFYACKKSSPDTQNTTIVGKWTLTKSCYCNSCFDGGSRNYQLLNFSQDRKFQIIVQTGDPVFMCTGTYKINHESYGDILKIMPDAQCTGFSIDSIITTQTTTTLVLSETIDSCISQNTYAATK